ncbi:MAG TPA: VWA domain-containing protein [Fredinandcohnia sp.]|nr:VWA domain-containing protein [Fredinandcohnia sp.]
MTAVAFSLLGIEMRLAEAGRWPWALAVVLALLAFLHGLARRERMLRDLTAVPALRARIVPGLAPGRGVLRGALALAALAAIFVALLRPQVGQREVTVKRRGIDIVVALDASRSMLARDVLPSRLARAKLELSQLVDRLQGDRIGIVVFAGEAFVQCPLTHDYAAAKLFLRAVDPEAMPSQGTAIAGALRAAEAMFDAAEDGARSRVVLLLTDGEDHSGRLDAAVRALADKGIRVYALGIGTAAGSPIPVLDASGEVVGYRKDRQGQMVISRLEDGQLRALAERTGGIYAAVSSGDLGMGAILAELRKLERTEREGQLALQWDEAFGIFLAPALLLLALASWIPERRREG